MQYFNVEKQYIKEDKVFEPKLTEVEAVGFTL